MSALTGTTAISITRQPKQQCSIHFPSFSVKNSELSQPHNVKHILPSETARTITVQSGKIIITSAIKRWLALGILSVGLIVIKSLHFIGLLRCLSHNFPLYDEWIPSVICSSVSRFKKCFTMITFTMAPVVKCL